MYKCRIAGDVWDAPQGVIGISFDDGPLPVSVFHLHFKHVTRVAFTRLATDRGPRTASSALFAAAPIVANTIKS